MGIISVDREALQQKPANVKPWATGQAEVKAMKYGLDELESSGAARQPRTSTTRGRLDPTQGKVEDPWRDNPALYAAAASTPRPNAQHPAFPLSRSGPGVPEGRRAQASGVPWWKRSRHWGPSRTQSELRRAVPYRAGCGRSAGWSAPRAVPGEDLQRGGAAGSSSRDFIIASRVHIRPSCRSRRNPGAAAQPARPKSARTVAGLRSLLFQPDHHSSSGRDPSSRFVAGGKSSSVRRTKWFIDKGHCHCRP